MGRLMVDGSMKRGKIGGTNIENGLRYATLTNLEEDAVIPVSCRIGRFEIRLVCDQNRDAQRKPAAAAARVRRCFRCLSTSHMRHECQNDVVCNYCGQSGHLQKDCEDHMELELGQPLEEQIQDQLHIDGGKADGGAEADSNDDENDTFRDASGNAEPQTDCRAVILGASLVKHVVLDMKGKALLVAKSGTCASEVEDLLQVAEAKLEAAQVEKVLMHLGTNDLSRAHGEVDAVKVNLVHAVTKVKEFFPAAVIGVAAVPPRKGKGTNVQKFNSDAKSVNKYLKTLANSDSSLEFLDTYSVFAPGGEHVVKRLYSDRDDSGIHFSPEGIKTLQGEFENFLLTQDEGKKRRRNTKTPSSEEKMRKKRS